MKSRRKWTPWAIAVAGVLASLLALAFIAGTNACGGGDEAPSATPTATSESCVELVYEVDLTSISATVDETLEAISVVIDGRLLRIAHLRFPEDYTVERQGDRIVVRLFDVTDTSLIASVIEETAKLGFRELTEESWALVQEQMNRGLSVDYKRLTEEATIEWKPAIGVIWPGEEVPLSGRHLKQNAQVVIRSDNNEPQVAFELDREGEDLLVQISVRLFVAPDSPLNRPLAIFFDDQLVFSPIVNSMLSGNGVIPQLTLERAIELAVMLNVGELPAPIGHWDQDTFVSGPAEENECS